MSEELSDSGQDDDISILEASRATHSPPRKKRRLNNNTSQTQQQYYDPSSTSTEDYVSDGEEKSISDKENSYQINVKNNKKRLRPTPYKFGKITYKTPLSANPGALVRLELQNFLCHSNFEISFHPNVNIISGQNGSGKSAVEAGISMALGQSTKKTGRGNKLADVIKDGTDWAKIKLYLHNQGPERLPEFGKEIVIERKLTRSATGGSSTVKVLDGDTLKTKGTGLKSVRTITDKFNQNVDNPCVVLKQSIAKKFLNSSKSTEKYKFFMQASKLGNYATLWDEAKENVAEALLRQAQTRDSFVAIRNQFYEAKQRLDTLERMEEQKEKVLYWERAERYMIYHQEKVSITKFEHSIESMQNKIVSSQRTLAQLNETMTANVAKANRIKQEIEEKTQHVDRHRAPVQQLRTTMGELEAHRKNVNIKVSAKQKFIDRAQRKINGYTQKYNEYVNSIQNNERGKKLASIQQKLNDRTIKLNQYRTEREPLRDKAEKSIEMKETEQKLVQKKTDVYHKQCEINKLNGELQTLSRQQNRSELFLHPSLRHRSHRNNHNRYNYGHDISVAGIRQCIQRHSRKFQRLPLGPLGEYIQMKPCNDQEMDNRHIQIVQAVLNNSLCVFLMHSSRDMQIFRDIMYREFGKTVPCVQYPYSNRMEQINANPFMNKRDIIRVSDMFTVKDNNAWVYNAILTNSGPERVYAYGDSMQARNFLGSLDGSRLRAVSSIMTYCDPKGLFVVRRNGDSVAGFSQRPSNPILQSDQTAARQWYQNQLNLCIQEKNIVDTEIRELDRFVQHNNQIVREYERKLILLNRNIKLCNDKVEKLERQQRDIREEEEDNNEAQEQMEELQNYIQDEKSQITLFETEITPFKIESDKLLHALSLKKRELQNIEDMIKNEQHSITLQRRYFDELRTDIKRQSVQIKKIPHKITSFEQELSTEKEAFVLEEQRINNLFQNALELGEEIKQDNYPRNPANHNRKYSLIQLRKTRALLVAEIAAWESSNGGDNAAQDIRQRFEAIKPKYEQHQFRVDNCNHNCDEMHRLLRHRKKEYLLMREAVGHILSLEFRYVMRQQGHDGILKVDYDKGTLDMLCRMKNHDGGTQLQQLRNSNLLSGGERSYAQIAFIMALQKFCGSPFAIYDEFDVFMDSVNRGNSIRILLNVALGNDTREKNKNKNKNQEKTSCDRQYIFITPNDVSPIIAQGHKDQISIHQLRPPRRSAK